MARGPEIPLWKRHVIGAYVWQLKLPLNEVAKKMDVSRQAAGNMLRRAKESCNHSEDLPTLMEALKVKERPGRPQRAPPGSDLALLAKEAVEIYPNLPIDRAVNIYLREVQESGGIDPHIRPLAAQQVYNLIKPKRHAQPRRRTNGEASGRGTAAVGQDNTSDKDPHPATFDVTTDSGPSPALAVEQGSISTFESTNHTSNTSLASDPLRLWTRDGRAAHALPPWSSTFSALQEDEAAQRGIM
ncbi:hypothetical protein Q7P35_002458 [Cladosporium inversicolor]